jgi:hypothetical protein
MNIFALAVIFILAETSDVAVRTDLSQNGPCNLSAAAGKVMISCNQQVAFLGSGLLTDYAYNSTKEVYLIVLEDGGSKRILSVNRRDAAAITINDISKRFSVDGKLSSDIIVNLASYASKGAFSVYRTGKP